MIPQWEQDRAREAAACLADLEVLIELVEEMEARYYELELS